MAADDFLEFIDGIGLIIGLLEVMSLILSAGTVSDVHACILGAHDDSYDDDVHACILGVHDDSYDNEVHSVLKLQVN